MKVVCLLAEWPSESHDCTCIFCHRWQGVQVHLIDIIHISQNNSCRVITCLRRPNENPEIKAEGIHLQIMMRTVMLKK